MHSIKNVKLQHKKENGGCCEKNEKLKAEWKTQYKAHRQITLPEIWISSQ